MDLNLKTVVNTMMDALEKNDALKGIDSLDKEPIFHSDEKATFVASKYVDLKTGPGRCDRKPLGMLVYVVTIEARFTPFDE